MEKKNGKGPKVLIDLKRMQENEPCCFSKLHQSENSTDRIEENLVKGIISMKGNSSVQENIP